jgi:heptaprenyl diphosphate synthase
MHAQYINALIINVLKSVVGGVFTFSLLTPLTMLSICGGIAATVLMILLIRSRIGFSIIGVSVAGAVIHNVVQLVLVRYFVIPNGGVYKLLPLMVAMGLCTGMIIALITLKLDEQVRHKVLRSGSGYEKDNI